MHTERGSSQIKSEAPDLVIENPTLDQEAIAAIAK